MKQLDQFLDEARKSPDKNPKIGALQIVKKYKDDNNVFLQFSDIQKLGIKPLSKFNTPLGIYSYHLKHIWNSYNLYNAKELSSSSIPYAKHRKYVILFKPSGNIVDFEKYNSKDYDDDMDKIKKLYGASDHKKIQSARNRVMAALDKLILKYESSFYANPAGTVKQERIVARKVWLKSFAIGASTVDSWFGNLLAQMETKGRNAAQKDYEKWLLKYDVPYREMFTKTGNDKLENIIDDATQNARVKSPAGAFWNVTRVLSNGNIAKWNKIFRDLGYDGFIDKGYGIIHPAEPAQAVFMSIKGLKIIEIARNKEYDTNNTEYEIKNAIRIKSYQDAKRFTTDFGYFANLEGILSALSILFKSGKAMKPDTNGEYYTLDDFTRSGLLKLYGEVISKYLEYIGKSRISLQDTMLAITYSFYSPLGPAAEAQLNKTNLEKKFASYRYDVERLINILKKSSKNFESSIDWITAYNYRKIFATHINETFDIMARFGKTYKKHDAAYWNNDKKRKAQLDSILNSKDRLEEMIRKYYFILDHS